MYEHIFQHSVTFLQNGSSRAMTHHHSPGWWVMTHHEKGKLCSATKLLNNVSDNITLNDFLSTKLVILLVFEDASTGYDREWVIGCFCGEVIFMWGKKWSFKTDDLLTEVQDMKFSMTGFLMF
jgi:hypothetical protein